LNANQSYIRIKISEDELCTEGLLGDLNRLQRLSREPRIALDLSQVNLITTQIARHLESFAKVLQLQGCKVVAIGLKPMTIASMVYLIDQFGIDIVTDLQSCTDEI